MTTEEITVTGTADDENADENPGRTAVRVVRGGPVLVEGPVDIQLPDGSHVTSDRFMVAVCACGRSRNYPLCDTSHRKRRRRTETS